MSPKYLSAVLLALATLSCAAPGGRNGTRPSVTALDQGASGRRVELSQGERLTVLLKGNPTTGFLWEVLPGSEPVLMQQGAARFTPASSLPGAGGSYLFTFQAQQPGSALLHLVYRRPFAREAAPAGSFEVTVVVGKAP